MHSFRIRLIIALIAGITVVSLASTYFEVLAHKHVLRRELERRTGWLGTSLQSYMERALMAGQKPEIESLAAELRNHEEALGLAVYAVHGIQISSSGPADLIKVLPLGPVKLAIKRGANAGAFGRTGNIQWLAEAVPLHVNGQAAGAHRSDGS